ncbi:unnamed protein product, partial [marine sediment metagenome]
MQDEPTNEPESRQEQRMAALSGGLDMVEKALAPPTMTERCAKLCEERDALKAKVADLERVNKALE